MSKQVTIEQAKKANLITFIVLEAIAVICLVVGLIVDLIFIVGAVFAATFFLGGIYLYFDGKKRIKFSFCPECKTKYDYNNDISWEESEQIEKENSIDAVVDFECVCHNCGNVREFSRKFQIAYYEKSKGRWRQNNLSSMVRKYFWK